MFNSSLEKSKVKFKNLRFSHYYNFFSPPNSSAFSFPKQNLRKLPIMCTGSTLWYHATLGANVSTGTIWTETHFLRLMSKEHRQQKSYLVCWKLLNIHPQKASEVEKAES